MFSSRRYGEIAYVLSHGVVPETDEHFLDCSVVWGIGSGQDVGGKQ